MSTVYIPVPQGQLRKLDDPSMQEGRFSFYLLAKVLSLPSNIPLDVNPRKQNTSSIVAKKIRDGLLNNPLDFHLLNRGITILAENAFFDHRKNALVLMFPDDEEENGASNDSTNGEKDVDVYEMDSYVGAKEFGIVDGGHTYAVLMEEVARVKEEVKDGDPDAEDDLAQASVRLEILVGVGDLAIDLARARNTSAQVREQSLADLGHRFDWLKQTIAGQPFAAKIAYKENEDTHENPKPIDIREVLQALAAFHPDYLSREKNPLFAYTSAGKCLKMFVEEEERYEEKHKPSLVSSNKPQGFRQLRPVVPEILRLYGEIQTTFCDNYVSIGGATNVKRRKSGEEEVNGQLKKGGGHARRYEHFIDRKAPIHFNGKKPKTGKIAPSSFVMPLLSAFRALLHIDPESGLASWKANPLSLYKANGTKYVEMIISSAEELKKPGAVGKSRNLWKHLHNEVLVDSLDASIIDNELHLEK